MANREFPFEMAHSYARKIFLFQGFLIINILAVIFNKIFELNLSLLVVFKAFLSTNFLLPVAVSSGLKLVLNQQQ